MAIDLKIIKEQVQGKVHVTVLHVRGWMDMHSEELLLTTARDAYQEGSRHLLIDLAEVITLKIFTPVEERSKLARVKLCNAPPQIHNVLGITGFLLTIQNYESIQAAIDSFTE